MVDHYSFFRSSFGKLDPSFFPASLRQKLSSGSDLDDSDVRTFVTVVYERYVDVTQS